MDLTRFFHPVMAAQKLRKKPLRFMLGDTAYVLFRDGQGAAAALVDTCPHRLAPLSKGQVNGAGQLVCPYHGFRFNRGGEGKSPWQGAEFRCNTRALQVREAWGYLWVADQATSESSFPTIEPDGYEFAGAFATPFACPLHVALDNFSENEHTPYVHTRFGWDEQSSSSIDFKARCYDDRSEVEYRAPQRWSVVYNVLPLHRGDWYHNSWVTRFDPVRADYRIHWSNPVDGAARPLLTRYVVFMVPETEKTTRFHTFVFLKTDSRWQKAMLPILKKVALVIAGKEVADDARFVPLVADTPIDPRGLRLGRFDKPVVHNRTLLRSLYFASPGLKTKAG